jgi:hypothetical protein
LATQTAPAAAKSPTGGKNQPTVPRPQPFRVGVYETTTPDADVSLPITTSQQKLSTWKVSPNGWLSGIWNLFEAPASGNSASVAFQPDGPFSAIFKVTFRDLGNREIFGPLTGYEWFTVNKWGGYFGGVDGSDPRNPVTFNATAGTGSTGGSFRFALYLPLELVHRDTLGEIENKSASSSYTLEIYIDASTNIYSTSPTVLPTIRWRANLDGYTEPEDADAYGRPLSSTPPAPGTVQYWTSEVFLTPNGLNKYNIQNGIGYSLRNLAFVGYGASAGTRAAAGYAAGVGATQILPDPTTLSFGKVQLAQLPLAMWLDKMSKWWELESSTADAFLGFENGVFVLPFTRDFINTVGDELRNAYLSTKAGNVLQWSGTVNLSGGVNEHFLVNYVVPPGNDPARLRSR